MVKFSVQKWCHFWSPCINLVQCYYGGAENARHENAGLENTAQNCRAGKCRNGKGWKQTAWNAMYQIIIWQGMKYTVPGPQRLRTNHFCWCTCFFYEIVM